MIFIDPNRSDVKESRMGNGGGDRVTEYSSAQPAGGRRNGEAAFMLELTAIRKELADRKTLRCVYDQRRERLGFGYQQFTKYVKRHIKLPAVCVASAVSNSTAPLATPLPPASRSGDRQAHSHEPKRATLEPRKGFHVDPMAARTNNLV